MRYCWDTVDQIVPAETVLESGSRAGFAEVSRRGVLGALCEYSATKAEASSPTDRAI
jgi:hypothetical protein